MQLDDFPNKEPIYDILSFSCLPKEYAEEERQMTEFLVSGTVKMFFDGKWVSSSCFLNFNYDEIMSNTLMKQFEVLDVKNHFKCLEQRKKG